jgi:hypothetical protein
MMALLVASVFALFLWQAFTAKNIRELWGRVALLQRAAESKELPSTCESCKPQDLPQLDRAPSSTPSSVYREPAESKDVRTGYVVMTKGEKPGRVVSKLVSFEDAVVWKAGWMKQKKEHPFSYGKDPDVAIHRAMLVVGEETDLRET